MHDKITLRVHQYDKNHSVEKEVTLCKDDICCAKHEETKDDCRPYLSIKLKSPNKDLKLCELCNRYHMIKQKDKSDKQFDEDNFLDDSTFTRLIYFVKNIPSEEYSIQDPEKELKNALKKWWKIYSHEGDIVDLELTKEHGILGMSSSIELDRLLKQVAKELLEENDE